MFSLSRVLSVTCSLCHVFSLSRVLSVTCSLCHVFSLSRVLSVTCSLCHVFSLSRVLSVTCSLCHVFSLSRVLSVTCSLVYVSPYLTSTELLKACASQLNAVQVNFQFKCHVLRAQNFINFHVKLISKPFTGLNLKP